MACCDDPRNVQLISCLPMLESLSLVMPPQYAVAGSPATGPVGEFDVTWNDVPHGYFLGNSGPLGQPHFQAIPFDVIIGNVPPGQGGLPPGGAAGTILTKDTGADYDASWQALTAVGLLPPGGTLDQFLVKAGPGDFSTTWVTRGTLPAGGSFGQILYKQGAPDFDTVWGDVHPPPTLTGGGAGQVLVKLNNDPWDNTSVNWEDTGHVEATISPAVNTNSTTSLMMGFGSYLGAGTVLTIHKSGMVLVNLYSYVTNDTAGKFCEWECRYGTGTPPAANAAITGTQKGTLQVATFINGGEFCPVASSIVIPNLIYGVTYWFDFTKKVSGGNGSWGNPTLSVTEL